MNANRTRTLVLGVLALAAFGGGAGIAATTAASAAPVTSVAAGVSGVGQLAAADPALAARLTFSREEERLARDLYQHFSDRYAGARPFSMIVRSEQQHFDAVGRLLSSYAVPDPAAGRAPGDYADPQLTQLWKQWTSQGSASLQAAYQVGVELEQRDIADLDKAIAATTQADVKQVLGHLVAGSRNHLRAFTAAASGQTVGSCDGTGIGNGPGAGNGPGTGHGPGMGNGPGTGRGPAGMGNRQGAGNGTGAGPTG